MGFWHTGYIEFHEPQGLGRVFPASRIRYRCQSCVEVFETLSELQQHRFEKHPMRRPTLFIRGVEIGNTSHRIVREMNSEDFVVEHSTKAEINDEKIELSRFGARLSKFRNDRVRVRLSQENVVATFDLNFEIAEETDLLGVEQAFLDFARNKRLDTPAIDSFISAIRSFSTSKRYSDGICQYLYGVLAKERAPSSSLAYEKYEEKFNQAVVALDDYETPLSKLICALIAFHFNHFKDAFGLLPTGRLALTSKCFDDWITRSNLEMETGASIVQGVMYEDLLSDSETRDILRWVAASPSNLNNTIEEIQAKKKDSSEYDRVKLLILLAEYSARLGEYTMARAAARELMNQPTMTDWAERILRRLPKAGKDNERFN